MHLNISFKLTYLEGRVQPELGVLLVQVERKHNYNARPRRRVVDVGARVDAPELCRNL